VTCWNPEKKKA